MNEPRKYIVFRINQYTYSCGNSFPKCVQNICNKLMQLSRNIQRHVSYTYHNVYETSKLIKIVALAWTPFSNLPVSVASNIAEHKFSLYVTLYIASVCTWLNISRHQQFFQVLLYYLSHQSLAFSLNMVTLHANA